MVGLEIGNSGKLLKETGEKKGETAHKDTCGVARVC